MIQEVTGDLLLSTAQVIAHGVAPGDHFNQGLALSLRERYPAMAKDFRHYCQLSNPKPGEIWVWAGADGRRIVNLMTQDAPKSKTIPSGAGDDAQRECGVTESPPAHRAGTVHEPGTTPSCYRGRRTRLGGSAAPDRDPSRGSGSAHSDLHDLSARSVRGGMTAPGPALRRRARG